MTIAFVFRRPLARLFLVGLLGGISDSGVQAGQVFSESFEFGPGVPGREHVVAGDAFEFGPVQEGEGDWSAGRREKRKQERLFEYVEGGGVRYVQAENRGHALLVTNLPARPDANTWEASLEFVPGTLWGKEDRSGVKGLWLGLVEGSDPQRLLARYDGSEIVVARVWFADDDSRAHLRLRSGSGPDKSPTRGEAFLIDPEATYRLVLRVEPAALVAMAVLEDSHGVVISEVSGAAPAVEGFNALKIDMTSLTFNTSGVPPVFKKVQLKTE